MTAPGRYFAISDAERSLICLRLVIEALAEREKYSDSETDWESLYHMAEVSTGLVQALYQMRQDAWQETDGARAEAKRLQQQLDALQQENNVLQQQLAEAQQQAEIADMRRTNIGYLQTQLEDERVLKINLQWQLDAARAEIVSLRQQLDEAQQQDVDAMRAFVGKVRAARDCYEWPKFLNRVEAALAELDAQPATVAETAEGGK